MEFLKQNQVFLAQVLDSQEQVFQFLAKQSVSLRMATDEQAVLNALKVRESEGTTGMMDGFAIPHAKTSAVLKAGMLIVQLNRGLPWNSMDGQPIDFILALFIPEDEIGATHLKWLSKIAKMLMKTEFKEQLKRADTAEMMVRILNKHLSEE